MSKIITVIVKIAGPVTTTLVTWDVARVVLIDAKPENPHTLVHVSTLVVVEDIFLASWLVRGRLCSVSVNELTGNLPGTGITIDRLFGQQL